MNTLVKNSLRQLISKSHDKRYFIWHLFYYCNLNCPYCFEKTMNKEKYFPKFEELPLLADKVLKIIKKTNITTLSIIGGEISVLNISILKKILLPFSNEKNLGIEITTNFTNDNSYYLEMLQFLLETKEIVLTLSYHSNFLSIKDFFEKIENMVSNSINKNIVYRIQYTVSDNTEKQILVFYANYLKLIKKFRNIKFKLSLFEEFHYDPNEPFKIINIYNSRRIGEKYPFLQKYLEQYKIYNSSFSLKEKDEMICPYNCYCYGYDILLHSGKLKKCNGEVISDNLENIDNLIFENSLLCKEKYCNHHFQKLTLQQE